ncbi:PAS domain S-box protein [Kineococcus sp. LSe6-4]|uniref:histidine kinase n=1 Tax=Kineococcus halophytocola TaxID=3234027 RepID=A0ABV4H3F4_9ACTN
MSAAAALRSAAFALAFAVAVLLGRATVMDGTSLSLVWPAAGVAVVWFGAQRSAGTVRLDLVLLSAATFALNAATGATAALAACFVVANVLQVLVFGALFARWCPTAWGAGGRDPLTGVAQLMRLLAAAVLATGSGAVLGPTAVWALTGHWSWVTTLVWMTRNTASILLIASAAFRVGCLLSARREGTGGGVVVPVHRPRGWRLAELAAVVACTAGGYALVFVVYDGLPVAFPLIALAAWAALRFDTTVVLVLDLAMGVTAVLLTLKGHGPFALVADDPTRAIVVQLYVAMLAVLGLALAMSRDERDVLVASTRRSAAASERLAREAAVLRAEAEARGELTAVVLESVDVGIVVADERGRLTMFNRTAQHWHGLDADTGLDPAEHAGRYDLFAADGRTPLAAQEVPLHRVLREGAVADVEVVIAPAGRPALTVVCSGRRMTRPDGSALGAVVVMADVSADRALRTDLEQARAQARQQADRLQAAFEASVVGTVDLALDGTVLRVNPAAAAVLGRTPAEVVGRSWDPHVHPEDRAAWAGATRALLEGAPGPDANSDATPDANPGANPGPAPGDDLRHLHRDGHVVHTHVATAVVRDGAGRPAHLTTQVLDVSSRVAAQEGVRRQRDVSARLLNALSDLGEGVLVEHDGQVTYANDALSRLTGRRTASLLALATSLLLVPEEEQAAWVERSTFTPGQVRASQSSVTALRHADGTRVPVEVTCVPLPDAGGRATLTLVRDLSEQRRVQDALARSNEQLREANRLKDDLVATLSHDLRQPLSTTTGFAELLLEDWQGLSDQDRHQHLTRIQKAGRWANDLLEDILTMAQLDAGPPAPRTTRVHVPALVADVVDRLDVPAGSLDTTGVQDLTVLAERGHLEQVLTNLVGNAVKYGRPPVRLVARGRGDHVLLDVVDAGEGVPPEFVPHLFDRFARATTGAAAGQKGTGLGLFIARTLVNANGGDLTYHPVTGGGSRFSLTLNAVPSPVVHAELV